VLAEALWLPDSKRERWSFDHICRASESDPWQTCRNVRLSPAEVAALIAEPALIVGARHRGQTRLAVLDIDARPGRPSPYWHPAGPECSDAFHHLEAAADAVGCALVTFRTPSGGWHVWALLPEAIHYTAAAEVGRLLAADAGLREDAAVLEVFPTPASWSDADAKNRTLSGGFRLPGQAGGAVWLGPAGWNKDPINAWAEALAALDATEINDAWVALLERALAARRRRRSRPVGGGRNCRSRRAVGIVWSGPGQSNRNLGALANALRRPMDTPEALGARIAAAARQCPGFATYASADTRARLDAWARDWAAACLRHPPRATGCQHKTTDAGRNHRLRRQSLVKIIDGALAMAKTYGADAAELSQRRIAEILGVNRATLRRFWETFTGRLAAALRRRAATGTDPLPQGGGLTDPGGIAGRPSSWSGFACSENPDLPSRPARNLPPCRDHPAQPPAMPTAPADRPTPRRIAERLELARWLGLSAL
jgi:hypothetical protein